MLLVTHMATYKHTCIHLYIYLLTSLYLSCFANSYQCWQAIIDKDQAELQAKGLHLPKVIALPHATNIDQWTQSTRLGHLMHAGLKRIREYEETYRASIPYDNNPRKLQDGITRKKQKLEHLDSVIHLDITPGYFSRVCRQMRNLKLCIAKDYHRFRLYGAPHDPEDLESGWLVPADIWLVWFLELQTCVLKGLCVGLYVCWHAHPLLICHTICSSWVVCIMYIQSSSITTDWGCNMFADMWHAISNITTCNTCHVCMWLGCSMHVFS